MKATRITTFLPFTLALLLPAGSPAAKKLDGVTLPDRMIVGGQQLQLNGMGKREATFGIDVYVAGLYLPQRTSNPAMILGSDGAKHMHLVFVRDVDRDDITKAWTDGLRKNNDPQKLAALRPRIARLKSWMVAMNKGDTLGLTYVPGAGTVVSVNGQRKGVIPGSDFAQALFSIWLGQRPPSDKLKQGLLGRR